MQTISLNHLQHERTAGNGISLSKKIEQIVAFAEANRFGISGMLILIQVTVAGFNVVIPSIVGASVWLMAPGVVMVFLANGLSLAQASMKWVLPAFGLSILINAAVSLYCSLQLF